MCLAYHRTAESSMGGALRPLLCALLLLSARAFAPSPRLHSSLAAPHTTASLSQSRLYGIPKLFRWLIDLYPIVLESVGEGMTGSKAMAVDNFYLDMNGIIHTCTHSNNDKLIVFDEKAMFQVWHPNTSVFRISANYLCRGYSATPTDCTNSCDRATRCSSPWTGSLPALK